MTPTFSFISYPGGLSILSESLRFRGHVKLFLIYQGCGYSLGAILARCSKSDETRYGLTGTVHLAK